MCQDDAHDLMVPINTDTGEGFVNDDRLFEPYEVTMKFPNALDMGITGWLEPEGREGVQVLAAALVKDSQGNAPIIPPERLRSHYVDDQTHYVEVMSVVRKNDLYVVVDYKAHGDAPLGQLPDPSTARLIAAGPHVPQSNEELKQFPNVMSEDELKFAQSLVGKTLHMHTDSESLSIATVIDEDASLNWNGMPIEDDIMVMNKDRGQESHTKILYI